MDIPIIDTVFGMESGYVLNFSNRTFANFFHEELGVDIYDDRWAAQGNSKAAGPLERRAWLGLLNTALVELDTVQLFRSTYPPPVEDALFVLLLILLKDPRDTPWQPFRIPWTFSFTDDPFSDPVAPPDPSSLSRQIVGDEYDQFEVPNLSEIFRVRHSPARCPAAAMERTRDGPRTSGHRPRELPPTDETLLRQSTLRTRRGRDHLEPELPRGDLATQARQGPKGAEAKTRTPRSQRRLGTLADGRLRSQGWLRSQPCRSEAPTDIDRFGTNQMDGGNRGREVSRLRDPAHPAQSLATAEATGNLAASPAAPSMDRPPMLKRQATDGRETTCSST